MRHARHAGALLALVLVGGLGMPGASEAQHRGRGAGIETTGSFQLGWQRLDLGELNPRLEAAGYPAFSEDFLSLGGSGHLIRQRVVLGGEGHGLLGPNRTTPDGEFRTRLSGGYGLVNVGYSLVSNDRARLVPTLGIGAGAVVLDILDRTAPSFDDVLAEPRRSAHLVTGGLILDGSLNLSVRLTESRRRGGGRRGLAMGVRGGYGFNPVSTGWRTNAGNDVAGGPDVAVGGPYVRLTFGGWHERPHRR